MSRRRSKIVRDAIDKTNRLRRELDRATLAELRQIRKISAEREGLADAILEACVAMLAAEVEEELSMRGRRGRDVKKIERELAESIGEPLRRRGRR